MTVVGRGIPGILPQVLVKNTRDSPRTRTNVAVTDAIPDVYIHRTISNAWGARTNARGTVSSLLFFFLNGILLPRSLSLPRRKGWTERGAATKVSREALSVTKQAVLRDHWRHYHNVRATYRMTRRVTGTRGPGCWPLWPPLFLCRCVLVERRTRSLSVPNCETCRHGAARIYPRRACFLSLFLPSRNSPPRRISNAKRDIRLAEIQREAARNALQKNVTFDDTAFKKFAFKYNYA